MRTNSMTMLLLLTTLPFLNASGSSVSTSLVSARCAIVPTTEGTDMEPMHGGGLNACGCHFNRKTGECHCHQSRGCGCECEPASCK